MEWTDFIIDAGFSFPPNAKVLDVGCGPGEQLDKLPVGTKIGIDLDHANVTQCHSKHLPALTARAEHLPFPDQSFDGIICKVVLPYTLEDQAISEMARVLKPGGSCYLVGHGSGYALRYLLLSRSIKKRFYGLRTLLNTWYWCLFSKRLPGFIGDSIYQSLPRLNRYFKHHQLKATSHYKTFLTRPVFIYCEILS